MVAMDSLKGPATESSIYQLNCLLYCRASGASASASCYFAQQDRSELLEELVVVMLMVVVVAVILLSLWLG